MAENHAGLKRSFQNSSPVKIDHTPPVVKALEVNVKEMDVNETEMGLTLEKIFATWSVSDVESDIQYCTCSIGKIVVIS